MPRSYRGHKFISCIIDEVTNYLITVPICQAKSEEIGEVLKNSCDLWNSTLVVVED